MPFSATTADLYVQPFEKALEIIAEAGFQDIEPDLQGFTDVLDKQSLNAVTLECSPPPIE
jgi:hypothetical protein